MYLDPIFNVDELVVVCFAACIELVRQLFCNRKKSSGGMQRERIANFNVLVGRDRLQNKCSLLLILSSLR